MDNNFSLQVKNGTINIEDLIAKINLADEQGLFTAISEPTMFKDADITGDTNVDNALSVLRTQQMIRETENSVRFSDAFANPAARTGWGEDNLINATEYPLTRLTQDWQLLTSLYRTSWIVQRVCNVIPEDALADLSIEAPGLNSEALQRLQEEIRSTHLRDSMLKGLRWGRLYGGAAAIIMVSGQEDDMSLPIDIDAVEIGAFRGLYIVDRWSGIYPGLDLVDDNSDPDYGLPEYYEVRNEVDGGSYRIHHSRVICFRGTEMPYWEQVAEQWWGTSAIESMYDELTKRDNVAHNIANLTFKANLSVLQVEHLDQMFATTSTIHQRRMFAMLQAINTLENSLGIRLVNKGDDIQQLQYSFAGLPEVMDSAMMDMAGATCIPVTRLFGRSPAGMNSTGESDEKMYRQTLEQERAVHITPALERLLPIVCRSALGGFPSGAEFKYPPLLEVSPMEKADIVDRMSGVMERLFQSNLVPGEAVLEAVRNAQVSQNITSTIHDEHIDKVRGKYFNDLQAQQADPFGGAMQAAAETGMQPQEPTLEEQAIQQTPEAQELAQQQQQEQEQLAQQQQQEQQDLVQQQEADAQQLSEQHEAEMLNLLEQAGFDIDQIQQQNEEIRQQNEVQADQQQPQGNGYPDEQGDYQQEQRPEQDYDSGDYESEDDYPQGDYDSEDDEYPDDDYEENDYPDDDQDGDYPEDDREQSESDSPDDEQMTQDDDRFVFDSTFLHKLFQEPRRVKRHASRKR